MSRSLSSRCPAAGGRAPRAPAAVAFLFAALVAAGIAPLSRVEGAPASDAPLVRVEGAPITRREWIAHLLTYYGRAGLRRLVRRAALEQEAQRYGVTVSEAEVQARLDAAKKAAGANFARALDAEGIAESTLRDRLREELLAEKVVDRKWPIRDEDLTRYSVRYARVSTRQQARDIIARVRREGQDFRLVVLQDSIDGRENGGLFQPDPFGKLDNPAAFRLVQDLVARGQLRPGQITAEPVSSGGFWLVLRLEKVYPAAELSPREREAAIARLRGVRIRGLAGLLDKRPVDYPVPVDRVVTDPDLDVGTIVAKLPEATHGGVTAPAQEITRGELLVFLQREAGKRALDQLVERRIIARLAERAGVAVSDAEVSARYEEFQKSAGVANFLAALQQEGITPEAWRERVRYTLLAEKVLNARAPVKPEELERLSVRAIRVATRAQAEEAIRALKSGLPWEQVAARTSLDRGGDGFLRPRPFLRSERPTEFRLIAEAGLRPGQVLERPVELGGEFLVLRLESRHAPETLKPEEREAAIRRINALRMNRLLDEWRAEVKVEPVVPLRTLIEPTS